MESLTIRKFQSAHYWTLLLLTIAECQFLAAVSMAAPILTFGGHFTDRRGPHSFLSSPVGDYVQLFAFLDSNDPIGSPTISVEASQSGTTLTLDQISPEHLIFEGLHGYLKFIDFDPALTGSWLVTATDSTGKGPSALTPSIAEPEFLPLVEDVTLQGTPLGATVSWTIPDLTGFDVDGVNVSVFTASGSLLWQSDLLTPQTTSFAAPAGVLEVGVDYVYAINLQDIEGGNLGYVENISRAYSAPFFYTVPGDFNNDGTVDTADYVVWRKTNGTQHGYDAWRTHFGTSLGIGGGAADFGELSRAVPSAGPLSATVPEPASLLILLLAVLLILARRCDIRSIFRPGSPQRRC